MPLFEKYEGQHEHQPAHIALRRDGSAVMGYDSVVGGGVPGDGWHGHTLRWDVSPMLTAAECEELATNTEVLELLRRTHYGHSIELDKSGSNMVGVLDSDATEASNDLTALLEKIEGTGQPWDIGDWWGDGGDKPMVREGESVRDAAARLVAEAHEDDDVYLIGGVDAVERFIEENQEDDR